MKLRVTATFFFCLFTASTAQYNDMRCRCTCKELIALSIPLKVYSKEAVQEDCNCLGVVLPELDQIFNQSETGTLLDQYCLGCQCLYEVRSTKTMEVVVIMYLILILGLFMYMLGIVLVDFVKKKQKKDASGDQESLVSDYQVPSTSRGRHAPVRHYGRTESSSSGSIMMKKLSTAQDEWKKQLRNQRNKVFERRNILQ